MKLTDEQIKEKLEHPELLSAFQRWRYRHIEEVRKKEAINYRIIKGDPDKNAIYIERKRKWKNKNKDRLNEERRVWRKNHKKKYKQKRRFYLDRLHALWKQFPEIYALHRSMCRKRAARFNRNHGVTRPYKPKMSMRIPDTCSFGNVLDRRSVFLWNNSSAASLIAGRAFQQMMWREAHCDRFGEVCR